MAPTTLMGQKTATSPDGRTRFIGQPLKMAELIAGLDGPVYVERVALFDAKQRVKAREGDQEGPPAAGREQGLRLRRGARRVPDPPQADAGRGREVGEGEDAAGLPARREEGRRARGAVAPAAAPELHARQDAGRDRRHEPGGRALLRGLPAHARGAGTSRSSWPARAATARRRRRCSSRAPRSTRASTRPTSRATAPSRAAARPTPTCTSRRTRCSRRRRPEPHVLVAFNAPSLAKFGPHVPGGRRRLRQLGGRRAPGAAAGREGGRRAVHADRHRPRQDHREEHRGPRRAPGGDAPLPARRPS